MLTKIKNFFKTEKRQADNWFPWSVGALGTPVFNPGSLPPIRRAISLYANLLISTPIKGEVPGWLESPCNFMSRSVWLTRLTENYWLDGNFYCLKNTQGNKIVSLPPFLPSTIYQYSRSRDPSDPSELENPANRYYQSSYESDNGDKRTSEYMVEDIFHIQNGWGSPPDMLNGLSLTQLCSEAVGLVENTLDSSYKYAKNFFISPASVTGVQGMKAEARSQLRLEVEKYLEEKKSFLTVDDSVEFKPLIQNNLAGLISIISSISSTGIARIFSIPSSLLEREDGVVNDGGAALKESHRHWLRHSGRAFLEVVGEAFSKLEGREIKFMWKAHQASDLREAGQSIGPLVSEGIIDKQQAKEWIE